MKKILGLLSVFLLVAINAQTVGDYKYVMIPSEFNTERKLRNGYDFEKFSEIQKIYSVIC
jgi:hypothetical protein